MHLGRFLHFSQKVVGVTSVEIGIKPIVSVNEEGYDCSVI